MTKERGGILALVSRKAASWLMVMASKPTLQVRDQLLELSWLISFVGGFRRECRET
jgi:hypothetical protein